MKADGSVIIDTKINDEGLEQGFEKLKKDASSLGLTCEKVGDQIKIDFSGADVSAPIKEAVAKVNELQQKLLAIEDAYHTAAQLDDDKGAQRYAEQWDEVSAKLEAAQQRLTQVIETEAEKRAAAEEKSTQRAQTAHNKAYSKAAGAANKFGKRLASIFAAAQVLNVIRKALSSMVSYFGDALKTNEQFSQSWARLKGTLLTAIQPIYNILVPTLTYLVDALSTAVEYAGRLATALAGGSYSDYAAEAEALYEKAKAIDAVSDAAKSIAGFDELNVLNNSEEDATSTGAIFTTEDDGSSLYFEQLADKVSEYGKLFEPTFSAWQKSFEELASAIGNPMQKIGDAVSALWDDTLAPFGDYLLTDFVPSIVNTFSENLAPVFSDVMSAAAEAFAIDFENATLAVEESCGWLQTAFGNVKTIFSETCSSVGENWDKYGEDILSGAVEVGEGLWDTFWNTYDDCIKPVLENAAKMFSWLWDNHLKPLWDNIVEFALSLWDNIMQLWNDLLKPIVDRFIAQILPWVTNATNGIVDAVSLAIGYISDAISSVLKVLDGVITFLVGVFTLDFKKAWDGIKKIFEGMWNGMVSALESCINSIIWGINQLIAFIYSGIASVVNDLGSIVETVGKIMGKDWGFSIPAASPKIDYISIPKLAQGAVIPANKEFLAVLGDQKHGTNIEAPLSTIEDAVANVTAGQNEQVVAALNTLIDLLTRVEQKDMSVTIGDETVGRSYDRYTRTRGVQVNSGAFANAY